MHTNCWNPQYQNIPFTNYHFKYQFSFFAFFGEVLFSVIFCNLKNVLIVLFFYGQSQKIMSHFNTPLSSIIFYLQVLQIFPCSNKGENLIPRRCWLSVCKSCFLCLTKYRLSYFLFYLNVYVAQIQTKWQHFRCQIPKMIINH